MIERVMPDDKRWNHNIHYHRLVLDAIPPGATDALDVGCGEGMLTRRLHETVPHVVGVDADAASIELAKAQGQGIDYICADFLSHPWQPASFDLVASIAALHHMDAAAALARMRDLLRPGGRLVVVGVARSRLPHDVPTELAAIAANTAHRLTKRQWQHPSPRVWPPPHTYLEISELARELLPGARYRRHLLWRYSIVWTCC